MSPASLLKLSTVCKVISEIDEEMPVLRLAILLDIAAHEGTAYHEIGQRLGVLRSALSRNISRLDIFGYSENRSGVGLVHTEEDPSNRRQRLCYLTPEGKRFLNRLEKAIS